MNEEVAQCPPPGPQETFGLEGCNDEYRLGQLIHSLSNHFDSISTVCTDLRGQYIMLKMNPPATASGGDRRIIKLIQEWKAIRESGKIVDAIILSKLVLVIQFLCFLPLQHQDVLSFLGEIKANGYKLVVIIHDSFRLLQTNVEFFQKFHGICNNFVTAFLQRFYHHVGLKDPLYLRFNDEFGDLPIAIHEMILEVLSSTIMVQTKPKASGITLLFDLTGINIANVKGASITDFLRVLIRFLVLETIPLEDGEKIIALMDKTLKGLKNKPEQNEIQEAHHLLQKGEIVLKIRKGVAAEESLLLQNRDMLLLFILLTKSDTPLRDDIKISRIKSYLSLFLQGGSPTIEELFNLCATVNQLGLPLESITLFRQLLLKVEKYNLSQKQWKSFGNLYSQLLVTFDKEMLSVVKLLSSDKELPAIIDELGNIISTSTFCSTLSPTIQGSTFKVILKYCSHLTTQGEYDKSFDYLSVHQRIYRLAEKNEDLWRFAHEIQLTNLILSKNYVKVMKYLDDEGVSTDKIDLMSKTLYPRVRILLTVLINFLPLKGQKNLIPNDLQQIVKNFFNAETGQAEFNEKLRTFLEIREIIEYFGPRNENYYPTVLALVEFFTEMNQQIFEQIKGKAAMEGIWGMTQMLQEFLAIILRFQLTSSNNSIDFFFLEKLAFYLLKFGDLITKPLEQPPATAMENFGCLELFYQLFIKISKDSGTGVKPEAIKRQACLYNSIMYVAIFEIKARCVSNSNTECKEGHQSVRSSNIETKPIYVIYHYLSSKVISELFSDSVINLLAKVNIIYFSQHVIENLLRTNDPAPSKKGTTSALLETSKEEIELVCKTLLLLNNRLRNTEEEAIWIVQVVEFTSSLFKDTETAALRLIERVNETEGGTALTLLFVQIAKHLNKNVYCHGLRALLKKGSINLMQKSSKYTLSCLRELIDFEKEPDKRFIYLKYYSDILQTLLPGECFQFKETLVFMIATLNKILHEKGRQPTKDEEIRKLIQELIAQTEKLIV